MDSQFNSLIQSYSSNFVQHKVTGNPSYQNAYISAQQGLDTIIGELQAEVNSGKEQISGFYKSGIEQKITELNLKNRKLQRGILTENDGIVAAKIRSEQPTLPSISGSVSTSQYVMLGLLGLTTVVLMVL
jgi:hypothetical protein